MSKMPSTLERRTLDLSPDTRSSVFQPFKSQRILACLLCQQRKIKCKILSPSNRLSTTIPLLHRSYLTTGSRKFPCANCIKSRAQCVPASQRQRKRRFSERTLLERLRKYEDLLRQNNIMFETPTMEPAREKESLNAESSYDSDDEHPELVRPRSSAPSATVKSENGYKAK